MIDRRKVAVSLVALGGVLTAVGTGLDMYRVVQKMTPEVWEFTTSLWGTKSTTSGYMQVDTLVSDALPVLFSAVLMVVAVVLTLRGGKVAPAARLCVLGAAGALFGVVVSFVVGVLQENEIRAAYASRSPYTAEMTLLPGFYLLAAAAVIALVGAVLVQRLEPAVELQEEDDEEAVVVHQFMDDDDTPPFGLAIPLDELHATESKRD